MRNEKLRRKVLELLIEDNPRTVSELTREVDFLPRPSEDQLDRFLSLYEEEGYVERDGDEVRVCKEAVESSYENLL